MCNGCWVRMGSPKSLPANHDRFAELYRAVYDQPNGGAGGNLHVVLDDMNLEDDDVQYAWRKSILTDTERACVAELRKMTEAERYASIACIEGWFEDTPPKPESAPAWKVTGIGPSELIVEE